MDTQAIREQFELLERFAQANQDHIAGVDHAPDYSWVRVDLHNTRMLVGDPTRRRLSDRHSLTFKFHDSFPTVPPVLEVGPERPVSAHVWRNRTVCLLQHSWYPARELWTAVVDFVEMTQRGSVNADSPADQADFEWLRGSGRGDLQALIGEPVRFRVPVETPAPSRVRVIAQERPSRIRVLQGQGSGQRIRVLNDAAQPHPGAGGQQ